MKKIIILLMLFFAVTGSLYASMIKENEELSQLLEAGRFQAAGEKIEAVKEPYNKLFWESRLSFYTGKYRDAYGQMDLALGYKEAKPIWETLKNYY